MNCLEKNGNPRKEFKPEKSKITQKKGLKLNTTPQRNKLKKLIHRTQPDHIENISI